MKRAVLVVCVIVLVFSSGLNSFAASQAPRAEEELAGKAMRYQYITSFYSSGTVSTTSASGEAQATIASGYKGVLTVSLERSSNGGNSYSKYVTLGTKTINPGSVSGYTSGSKNSLSTSYTYRVKAEIKVYDTNNNLVDSDYEYYY